jgi:hypothetical protein
MSEPGHSGKVTAAQRAEVLRLRAEGASIRRIAVAAFGDVRFRGRVERIIAATAGSSAQRPAEEPLLAGRAEALLAQLRAGEEVPVAELVRFQLDAWLSRYLESGRPASPAQLAQVLRVSRQLDGLEELERLRVLHRGRAAQ